MGLKKNPRNSIFLRLEGVDFDFAWAGWADVGHKAAAVNLSDIAAM